VLAADEEVLARDIAFRIHQLRDWIGQYTARGDAANVRRWATQAGRCGRALLRARDELGE
jgi:hypothetical protein